MTRYACPVQATDPKKMHMVMQQPESNLTACIKNKTMLAYGNVNGVAVTIQAHRLEDLDSAKAVALEAFAHAAKVAKLFQAESKNHLAIRVRIQAGILHVEGEVWESDQLVQAKALAAIVSLEGVVRAYKSKLHDGVIVVKGKTNKALMNLGATCTTVRLKAIPEGIRTCTSLGVSFGGFPLSRSIVPLSSSIAAVVIEAAQIYRSSIMELAKINLLEPLISAKGHCQEAAASTWMRTMHVLEALAMLDGSSPMSGDCKEVLAMGAGGLVGAGAGGVTGFTAGISAGVVCGLPLAIFTYGLSVPVGAAIGGSAGTSFGAITGAALGLMSVGSTDMKQKLLKKVRPCRDYIPQLPIPSVKSVKDRFIRSAVGMSRG